MFADRLSTIMKTLNVNNKQLSEFSHLDSSSLSRLTKGSRTPSEDSITVRKVTDGLYSFAESDGKMDALCLLVEEEKESSPDNIKSSIIKWLYMDQPSITKASRSQASDTSKAGINRSSRKRFGVRFNDAMELAGMSNIYLSRRAYVDPSLISRYRSGLRSPVNNPEAAELLSSIIYKQIETSGRISDLSLLMNERPETMNESLFNNWLYADGLQRDMDVTSTEKLLTAFESFTLPEESQAEIPFDLIPDEETDKGKRLYVGPKGLCSAVIRFLSSAAKTGAEELYLFSNQNMDWMTEDPTFLPKWAALMKACIANGTRINIIHNIDRSYEEMNSAIIAWHPLYMSGMITPYYCTLPTGALFSQTLFLNPGHCCINANLVAGTEKEGLYYYYMEEPYLSFMQVQFNNLLGHSRPLVDIMPSGTADLMDFADSEDLRIIQPELSLLSMPEAVATSYDSPGLMKKWNDYDSLSRVMKNRRVFVCATLYAPEVVKEGSCLLEAVPGSPEIYYTQETYKKHVNNEISLMNSHPGYRLIALPEAPFSNMQLIISDEHVRITRTAPPYISFTFTHPQMCHAFKNYSDKLIKQYMTDRRIMIRQLSELYL